jgi:hypothetical protein
MTNTVYLTAGQQPPTDQDWILVERGAAGGFFVSWGKAGAAVGRSDAPKTAQAALEYAGKLAQQRGVKTIYSKGV